jgi:hypothetical protein
VVTAIYAVVLAIAALGGNHAMKEMLLLQPHLGRGGRRLTTNGYFMLFHLPFFHGGH